MWLAHRYRNDLVRAELDRRDAVAKVQSADPVVAALEARQAERLTRLTVVRGAIKARRQVDRSRTPALAAELAEVSELREALRRGRDALRTARAAARADAEPALAAVNENARQRVRDLRAEYSAQGLYWGTYLLAEAAVRQASSGPEPPRFRRWDGSGRVAVQIQHGITGAEIRSGTDTRVQLRDGVVRLRVGSDGRDPVWVTLPVVEHRPLPADATIMWAIVSRARVGKHYRWRLHLSLRLDVPLHRPGGDGAVAVDVGWRLLDGGAERVGYCWDGDRGWPLVVPAEITGALRKVESLASIRDTNYLYARATMADLIASGDVPDWLREECATLAAWRSPQRLSRLLRRWRDEMWPDPARGWRVSPGDADDRLLQLLRWREQEEHLHTWQEHARDQALARRRDLYRVWAAQLRERYHTVVMETACVRDLARLPNPEDEDTQRPAHRHQRQLVAQSELRAILQQCGLDVALVPHQRTTLTCHACGHVEAEVGEELIHTCSACGRAWDQDDNAARNLMARWRERSGSDGMPGGARGPEAEDRPRSRREGYGFGAASRAKRAKRSQATDQTPVAAGG